MHQYLDKRLNGSIQGLGTCARQAERHHSALNSTLGYIVAYPSHASDNIRVTPGAFGVQHLDRMEDRVLRHAVDRSDGNSGSVCTVAVIIPPDR